MKFPREFLDIGVISNEIGCHFLNILITKMNGWYYLGKLTDSGKIQLSGQDPLDNGSCVQADIGVVAIDTTNTANTNKSIGVKAGNAFSYGMPLTMEINVSNHSNVFLPATTLQVSYTTTNDIILPEERNILVPPSSLTCSGPEFSNVGANYKDVSWSCTGDLHSNQSVQFDLYHELWFYSDFPVPLPAIYVNSEVTNVVSDPDLSNNSAFVNLYYPNF